MEPAAGAELCRHLAGPCDRVFDVAVVCLSRLSARLRAQFRSGPARERKEPLPVGSGSSTTGRCSSSLRRRGHLPHARLRSGVRDLGQGGARRHRRALAPTYQKHVRRRLLGHDRVSIRVAKQGGNQIARARQEFMRASHDAGRRTSSITDEAVGRRRVTDACSPGSIAHDERTIDGDEPLDPAEVLTTLAHRPPSRSMAPPARRMETVRSLRRAALAAGATHGSGVSGGHRPSQRAFPTVPRTGTGIYPAWSDTGPWRPSWRRSWSSPSRY